MLELLKDYETRLSRSRNLCIFGFHSECVWIKKVNLQRDHNRRAKNRTKRGTSNINKSYERHYETQWSRSIISRLDVFHISQLLTLLYLINGVGSTAKPRIRMAFASKVPSNAASTMFLGQRQTRVDGIQIFVIQIIENWSSVRTKFCFIPSMMRFWTNKAFLVLYTPHYRVWSQPTGTTRNVRSLIIAKILRKDIKRLFWCQRCCKVVKKSWISLKPQPLGRKWSKI